MDPIGKLRAYRKGHRLLRLRLKATVDKGGYVFVNTPDLPGFSVMLSPVEMESFDLFAAALGKPLEAFVNAEHQAAQKLKDGTRVRLKGMEQRNGSEIDAVLCTA
jgi:hypothetical protein